MILSDAVDSIVEAWDRQVIAFKFPTTEKDADKFLKALAVLREVNDEVKEIKRAAAQEEAENGHTSERQPGHGRHGELVHLHDRRPKGENQTARRAGD